MNRPQGRLGTGRLPAAAGGLSALALSAVGETSGIIDEARFVRAKEKRRPGDLLGLAPATERTARAEARGGTRARDYSVLLAGRVFVPRLPEKDVAQTSSASTTDRR